MRNFFSELKRRNVYRVAVMYVLAAWLLMQVADVMFPALMLPEWSITIMAIVLLIGFPISLLLAWVFEITPHGLKIDSGSPGQAAPQTARNIDIVIIGLLSAVVIFYSFTYDWSRWADDPHRAVETPSSVDVGHRGVAVLPFENLSADEENAFFAGGVHEDVLSHLSRIEGLRVISRTSMLRIAKDALDIQGIVDRLRVTHVLEGSVRRDGDRVRVTVQLIDGSTDGHLWAETYDRRLNDIFAIQTEIALSIAAQLELELSPTTLERLHSAPTENLESYDLFIKARELTREVRPDRYTQAIPLLERALEIDPGFIEAMVQLSHAHGRMVWFLQDTDGLHAARSQALIESMEANWPDRPETHVAKGDYYYTVKWDYPKAHREYTAALLDLPSDPHLILQMAIAAKRTGRPQEQRIFLERAIAIDPERPTHYTELVVCHRLLGNTDRILEIAEEARRRFPGVPNIELAWAMSRARYQGDFDALERIPLEETGSWEATSLHTWVRVSKGDVDGAKRFVKELERVALGSGDVRQTPMTWVTVITAHWDLAAIHWITNQPDLARAWARSELAKHPDNTPPPALSGTGPIYAQMASIAAFAGDRDAWSDYIEAGLELEIPDPSEQDLFNWYRAVGEAVLGNPEIGWRHLEPRARHPGRWSPGQQFAYRPLFEHLFGEVAEYREFQRDFESDVRMSSRID